MVRTGLTWSMFAPPEAVSCFQPAAWAEGAARSASAGREENP